MSPAKNSLRALALIAALASAGSLGRVTRADELEDPPTPLEEATPRTKEEQTHLDALSLFGAGALKSRRTI